MSLGVALPTTPSFSLPLAFEFSASTSMVAISRSWAPFIVVRGWRFGRACRGAGMALVARGLAVLPRLFLLLVLHLLMALASFSLSGHDARPPGIMLAVAGGKHPQIRWSMSEGGEWTVKLDLTHQVNQQQLSLYCVCASGVLCSKLKLKITSIPGQNTINGNPQTVSQVPPLDHFGRVLALTQPWIEGRYKCRGSQQTHDGKFKRWYRRRRC